MDNTNKILIITVIVLVGILGLTGGYFLQSYLNKPVNNTTNSTNSSQNNQTNSTNQDRPNNNNNFISESQAISIAKSAWPVSGATYSISSYPTSDSPYYWVSVINYNYEGPGGNVKINAYTGEVVLKGT